MNLNNDNNNNASSKRNLDLEVLKQQFKFIEEQFFQSQYDIETLELIKTTKLSSIFKCRLLEQNNIYDAIKVAIQSAEDTASFTNEVKNLFEFQHKRIVKIKNFKILPSLDKAKIEVVLIEEFADQGSLEQFLSLDKRLKIFEIINLIKDIGKALNFIHAKGLLHLDLKPANILVFTHAKTSRKLFKVSDIAGSVHLTRNVNFHGNKTTTNTTLSLSDLIESQHKFKESVSLQTIERSGQQLITTELFWSPEIHYIYVKPNEQISLSIKTDMFTFGLILLLSLGATYHEIKIIQLKMAGLSTLNIMDFSERSSLEEGIRSLEVYMDKCVLQLLEKKEFLEDEKFQQFIRKIIVNLLRYEKKNRISFIQIFEEMRKYSFELWPMLDNKGIKANIKQSQQIIENELEISKEGWDQRDISDQQHQQFLYYFQGNSQMLYILEIPTSGIQQNNQIQFQVIQLTCLGKQNKVVPFYIPDRGRAAKGCSDCQIFFSGGVVTNLQKSFQQKTQQKQIYQYIRNPAQNTLIKCVGSMLTSRQWHAAIVMNRFLYIIGGYNDVDKSLNKCERFNIDSKQTEPIAPMSTPSHSHTCTVFEGSKQSYLLKIGGFNKHEASKNFINEIECYYPSFDEWQVIKIRSSYKTYEVQNLYQCGAIQINKNQVFIFGGCDSSGFKTSQSLVLQINEEKQENIQTNNQTKLQKNEQTEIDEHTMKSQKSCLEGEYKYLNRWKLIEPGWFIDQPVINMQERAIYVLRWKDFEGKYRNILKFKKQWELLKN